MSLTVFTYHRVLPKPHPDALTVELFERQLDWLGKNFDIITPENAFDFILGNGSRTHGKKLAMLSFDDGWLDNWLFATPVLKKRGLRAALALSAGFLHSGQLRERAEDVPAEILCRKNLAAEKIAADGGDTLCYVSREEVRAMHDSGSWCIEAHGTTHRKNDRGISFLAAPATGVPVSVFRSDFESDLKNCIEEINTITGREPQMFFYPWGQFSDESLRAAKKLGFRVQFSTQKGSIAFGAGTPGKILPRVNAAADWGKFTRNARTFSNSFRAKLHDIFAHTEKLKFD